MFYNANDFNWLGLIGGLVMAGSIGGLVSIMGGDDIAGFVAIPFYFVGIFLVELWQKRKGKRNNGRFDS
jgi:hypothetical protein